MIINSDCFEYIKTIESSTVDLVLIDPPYLISKDSGFKSFSDGASDDLKVKYGKLSIDFGDWDKQQLDWHFLFKEYYRILRDGGTLIMFYDIWKAGEIKQIAKDNKFKQARIGQWQKTNPVPVNSKTNYLSNSIEYFFTFTKGSKPTFNSKYDSGIYKYPLCHGKERTEHPTQKPIALIKDLVEKHSNPGDLVVDTFAGSGTTGLVCELTKRKYILVERDKNYFTIIEDRLQKSVNKYRC